MDYKIRKATHVGRDHIVNLTNCQDAIAVFEGNLQSQQVVAGIVCDGCSSGKHSETGANLGSAYIIREITRLGRLGVPTKLIPSLIYPNLLGFLRGVLSAYNFTNASDLAGFINNHLLFTVVGFIITEKDAVCFIAGDGTIVINNDVSLVDSNNQPKYPAYHLVDRKAVGAAGSLPEDFDTILLDRRLLKRLAIGSDAWHREVELLGQSWEFNHPSGLQRRINQWSKTEHRFSDDVSLITVELTSTPETEDPDGSSNQ